MSIVDRVMARVDRFQQSHRWLAFPYAVVKKIGDDQAGNLAALIAYYGFFSIFPLLLVFVSVLGLVLRGHPSLQQGIVNSALRNFPVIGGEAFGKNLHAIQGGGVALAVGIAGTLWAGLGVTQTAQNAMNTVWNVPRKEWPSFLSSRIRGLLMLVVLGTIVVVSTFAGGFGASGGTNSAVDVLLRAAGMVVSLAFNLALFAIAYRVLTVARLTWRDVLPGSVVAAVLWTLLQVFGGYYVTHQVKGASNVYGTFAIVIGLLVWIYLGAQVTLYCAEVNVVKARRLWPRALKEPPPPAAERDASEGAAEAEQRLPEQRIDVEFDQGVEPPTGRRQAS